MSATSMSERSRPARSASRAWLVLFAAATAVGLFAMAANVTTVEQISGLDQGLAAVRKTVSRLASAGVLWAGVAVLGGWLVRRLWQAALAGVLGLLVAVVVHYSVGQLAGLMPWATMTDNGEWFVAALVLGPPLGLVGAACRRRDVWGLLARLTVPLGAVMEPFVAGWLPPLEFDIWANRVSALCAGCLMIAGGLVAAALVIPRWRAGR